MKYDKLNLAQYNEVGKTIREAVEAEKPLDYYIEKYNCTLVALASMIPRQEHLFVLKKMFKERESVDLNNLQGINPVELAVKNRNLASLSMLLHQGANINFKLSFCDEWVLHYMIEQDWWYFIRRVLEHDSTDLEVTSKKGYNYKDHAEFLELDLVYEEIEKYEKRNLWGSMFSDEEKENYKGIDHLDELIEEMKNLEIDETDDDTYDQNMADYMKQMQEQAKKIAAQAESKNKEKKDNIESTNEKES